MRRPPSKHSRATAVAQPAAAPWLRWLGLYRPSQAANNDGYDAAKIAAIALMAVNHVLLAWPMAWHPWPYWGYLIGRPCVPIFTFIIAARLAEGPPERATRMLVRLIIWAIVAQPIYFALVGQFAMRLSILATLAAGVALTLFYRKGEWAPVAVGAIVLIAGNRWLDSGAWGAIAVLAGAALYGRSRPAALAAVTLCAIAGDLLETPEAKLAALTALGGPI